MITILIDDGDVFEGTPEQFQECFFSNDFDEGIIREWAAEIGSSCEFIYGDPMKDRKSLINTIQELINVGHITSNFTSVNAIRKINKEISKLK